MKCKQCGSGMDGEPTIEVYGTIEWDFSDEDVILNGMETTGETHVTAQFCADCAVKCAPIPTPTISLL